MLRNAMLQHFPPVLRCSRGLQREQHVGGPSLPGDHQHLLSRCSGLREGPAAVLPRAGPSPVDEVGGAFLTLHKLISFVLVIYYSSID